MLCIVLTILCLKSITYASSATVMMCYDCMGLKRGHCFSPRADNDTNVVSCNEPYCYQQQSLYNGVVYVKRGCAKDDNFCNMNREHKGRITLCEVCEYVLCNFGTHVNCNKFLSLFLILVAMNKYTS